jgi:hypothetical protein
MGDTTPDDWKLQIPYQGILYKVTTKRSGTRGYLLEELNDTDEVTDLVIDLRQLALAIASLMFRTVKPTKNETSIQGVSDLSRCTVALLIAKWHVEYFEFRSCFPELCLLAVFRHSQKQSYCAAFSCN